MPLICLERAWDIAFDFSDPLRCSLPNGTAVSLSLYQRERESKDLVNSHTGNRHIEMSILVYKFYGIE